MAMPLARTHTSPHNRPAIGLQQTPARGRAQTRCNRCTFAPPITTFLVRLLLLLPQAGLPTPFQVSPSSLAAADRGRPRRHRAPVPAGAERRRAEEAKGPKCAAVGKQTT